MTIATDKARGLLAEAGLDAPLTRDELIQAVQRAKYRIGKVPEGWRTGSFRGGRYLLIQSGLSNGQWLWEVAHELGHAVMHRVSSDDGVDRTYSWTQEREADDFAGELLIGFDQDDQLEIAEGLPTDKVREWIQRQYEVTV